MIGGGTRLCPGLLDGEDKEIFTDLTVWMGVKKAIDTINVNAAA